MKSPMIKKRVLSFIFALIMMFAVVLPVNALDNQDETDVYNGSFEKNMQSWYYSTRFKEEYTTIVVSRSTQISVIDYPDNYGGAYIDDNDELHIAYVNSLETISIDSIKDNAFFDDVKYSFNYLSDIVECLNGHLVHLSINQVHVDEFINRVRIFTDSDFIETIESFLKKHLENFDAESIIYSDPIVVTQTDVAGETIKSGSSTFTLGYNAKKASTGKYGLVTCGHAVSKGDTIKRTGLFGATLGTVEDQQLYGKIDASFAPYKTQSRVTADIKDGFTFTRTTSGSTIVAGCAISKYGHTTGSQNGSVLATSVSVICSGIEFTDQLKLNIRQEPGDSGCPVYGIPVGPFDEPKLQAHLFGIVTIADTTTWKTAWASKADNINNAFGLTTYIIA